MALTAEEQRELDELEYMDLMAKAGQAPTSEQPSAPAEAALQGLGQGASFGYLPEMQAGAQAPLDWALEKVASTKLGAKIMDVPQGATVDSGDYESRLKEARARDKSLAESNPNAYLAGNVAGAITVPIPGLGAAKGATAAARLANAAVRGAGVGGVTAGLQNVPEGTPSLMEDPLANLNQRMDQAETGALMGGAFGAAGQGLSDISGKTFKKLKTYFAGKQMGLTGQTRKAEKLIKDGKMEKLADFMDETGMMGLGKTPDDSLAISKKILKETGREIGDTYKDLQSKIPKEGFNMENATPEQLKKLMEHGSLDPKEMATKIWQEAQDLYNQGRLEKTTLNAIKNEAQMLSKRQASIDDVLDYRKSLDDRLNKIYQKPMADMTDKEASLVAMRREVKQKLDRHLSALDDVYKSKASEKLKKLNDTYSKASDIKNVSEKYVIKGEAKNTFGLPEYIVGAGAGGASLYNSDDPTSAAAKGLGTAALLGLGRRYGPNTSYQLAKGANILSGAAAKSPYIATKGVVSPWIQMQNREKGK